MTKIDLPVVRYIYEVILVVSLVTLSV